MSSELSPYRRNTGIQRQTARGLTELASRTQIVQAKVRATSAAAEFALSEVTFLKRTQRELEQAVPDASEALGLIANTAAMAIARMVARFGTELGG